MADEITPIDAESVDDSTPVELEPVAAPAVKTKSSLPDCRPGYVLIAPKPGCGLVRVIMGAAFDQTFYPGEPTEMAIPAYELYVQGRTDALEVVKRVERQS